jgi:hypothetical protein
MKKIIALFFSLFVLSFVIAPVKVFAVCPWYNPLCTTPTPTPTPTPIIFQKVGLPSKLPALITTATATPTPTTSPTPTATLTPTITATVAVSPTVTTTPETSVTPETSISQAPVPTITPAQPQTLVMGFTLKEVTFALVAIVLLVVLVLQSNWAKIKTWLHEKTS